MVVSGVFCEPNGIQGWFRHVRFSAVAECRPAAPNACQSCLHAGTLPASTPEGAPLGMDRLERDFGRGGRTLRLKEQEDALGRGEIAELIEGKQRGSAKFSTD